MRPAFFVPFSAAMQVTDAMFAALDGLLGKRTCGVVEFERGEFVVGYREGRDVCVFARGKTWAEAEKQATDRVSLVDRLIDTTSDNAAVATAAGVPVRFVRLRRRDRGPSWGRRS